MVSSVNRPTKLVVNTRVISRNISNIRELLKKSTKIFAVVKANAYGLGAKEISTRIQPLVDFFAVSSIDEALELRSVGISKGVLVLGVSAVKTVELAISQNISLAVSSAEWVENLLSSKVDLSGLNFHIKVDSGMGRIGFKDLKEIKNCIKKLESSGGNFEGIFTHFSSSESSDFRKYDEQLAFFKDVIGGLDCPPEIIHASNSAATIFHDDAEFNAVRIGKAMYGRLDSDLEPRAEIENSFELMSELVEVKKLKSGESCGYSESYIAPKDEFIGIVPIGYADGIFRSSQGMSVVYDDGKCQIVGRISMDQMAIRLPRKLKIGEKVLIISAQEGSGIECSDWAKYNNTIQYEIATSLSSRISREYL